MPARNKVLPELSRLTTELKSWLEQDPKLDLTDQMFLENHLHVLHLAYATWKARVSNKEGSERTKIK